MLARVLVILALAFGSLLAAAESTADPRAQRGAELLQPFKQNLRAALAQGLADGPAAAIDACRVQAPAVAARLSRNGVRMGRSSHRLRNPVNRGPAWVAPLVARYTGATGKREPLVVSLGKGRVGYVEPIYVQPQCLVCHGAQLAPAVALQVDALYPDDQATGFAAGDFRGVFWVEFPQGP